MASTVCVDLFDDEQIFIFCKSPKFVSFYELEKILIKTESNILSSEP